MTNTNSPALEPTSTPVPVPVTLLTQADCALCEQAKTVLARTSDEHLTTVTEVALTTEAGRTLALQHTVLIAPGVLVAGQVFSNGRLSEKKLRRHLHQLATPPLPTTLPSDTP